MKFSLFRFAKDKFVLKKREFPFSSYPTSNVNLSFWKLYDVMAYRRTLFV